MTTACEEKSAANFTREVGDQSVSIGVLMFVLVFITVTCSSESYRVFENLLSVGLFVYFPGQERTLAVLWNNIFTVSQSLLIPFDNYKLPEEVY